jgi:ubiquinone/menaquinone biosynthesis C-methylase UbiE
MIFYHSSGFFLIWLATYSKPMAHTLYLRFKQLLPAGMRRILSRINQRFFARRTIQRKYGMWFDVDWRKKFRTMSNEEWITAYDTVWQQHHNDCTDETDTAMIIEVLGGKPLPSEVQSVLEVGRGAGSLAIAMAKEGFFVSCVDVSNEALQQAKKRAEKLNINIAWKQGFAEALPFDDKSFDAITCCHTLEHVRDLDVTVQELKRVARKRIVIVVPRQEYHLYSENYHTQFFTETSQLITAFGLAKYQTRELNYIGRDNEFQDEALMYIGFLDSENAKA